METLLHTIHFHDYIPQNPQTLQTTKHERVSDTVGARGGNSPQLSPLLS